jgi:hypothetical protein
MPLKFDCEFVTRCCVIRVQEIRLGNGLPDRQCYKSCCDKHLHGRSLLALIVVLGMAGSVVLSGAHVLRLQHPSRSPMLLGHLGGKLRV